jgi:hypothetical protein
VRCARCSSFCRILLCASALVRIGNACEYVRACVCVCVCAPNHALQILFSYFKLRNSRRRVL